MKDTDDAIRQGLQKAVLHLLECSDRPFSEEELLAKYLELSKEENLPWIRELLSLLDKAQNEQCGEE